MTGLRWQDFGESERWKAAWGVWWRIALVSIAFWSFLTVIIVFFLIIGFQFTSNEISP